MMHTDLLHHYEKIFAFKQYHNWSLSEIEEMIPWEFDIMTTLLNNYLETIELQRKQREANL